MWKLLRSFKTEINPSEEQKVKIHKTIGTCRFIYNFYLAHNKELYDNGEKFMSSNRFRVWLNNEYLSEHPEYSWIKEAYSKAVTQSVNNGQTAFTRFFNHESAFPKFKKKGRSDVKMYFVKNNPKDCRWKGIESIFRHLVGSVSKKKDIFQQLKTDMWLKVARSQ